MNELPKALYVVRNAEGQFYNVEGSRMWLPTLASVMEYGTAKAITVLYAGTDLVRVG